MKNLLIILVLAFFNPIVNYSQIVVRGDTAFKVDPITQEETVLLTKPRVTVRVTDTSVMLTPYLRSNIAAATYQAKGAYISASDTAAAFTPYLRSNVAAATYQTKGNYIGVTDTASMLSKYLRSWDASTLYQAKGNYQPAGNYLNISDSAAMLSKYLRSNVAAATYQPIGSYQAAGTYVNASDTAAMLSKYLRGWDASTIYASISNLNLKAPLISPAFTTPNIGTATGNSLSVTGSIGYSTGAGGTVTQATSKSTGVTLNKITGEIVLNAAALAAATIVSFTLTNSTIAATDVIILNHVKTGTKGAYGLNGECLAGTATITVRNNSAASLSEAIVIRYAIIKSVTN
jgi:hypothetical protein